jgi:GntR family transcriptional regulator
VDLFRQVADLIEQEIDDGRYPVGSRLPGQAALAEQYGVSDRVIREAQSALMARGRVIVRPRSGTYVVDQDQAQPAQRLVIGDRARRNEHGYLFNAHAGHWPPIGDPTRGLVECPVDVAQALDVEPGAQVLARRRVVGIGPGEPMQITTTYLHPDLVARLPIVAEQDTGPGGWVERAELDLGLGPARFPRVHMARLPTEQEANDLGMPPALPVLVELRKFVGAGADVEGPALAVDEAVRDARRFEVHDEMTRADSAAWPYEPATVRNLPEPRSPNARVRARVRDDKPQDQVVSPEPGSRGPTG